MIGLCPWCLAQAAVLFLLWLIVLFFAKVCKFKWAIRFNDWCLKKSKAIYAAARGKTEVKCDCEECRKD